LELEQSRPPDHAGLGRDEGRLEKEKETAVKGGRSEGSGRKMQLCFNYYEKGQKREKDKKKKKKKEEKERGSS
jgi:hypothetical protein